jgi:predicted DNA-binding transcriptional regulator YafY
MTENKTLRILKMLMMLSGSKSYKLEEVAVKFNVSGRTIIRDLNEIESAGFVLERKNSYRLQMDHTRNRDLKRLLHFTEDEVAILYKTLLTIEGDTAVIDRLMKKMNAFYDLKAIEELSQKNDLAKVQSIKDAIDTKKQAVLKSYRSSNSDTIHDRRVEPFQFMQDYQTVWCYDCETHMCKQFKISRMDAVELQEAGWRYEDNHKEPFTAIFRYSEDEPRCTAELRLTLKAYNALVEEYPRSADYISEEDNHQYYLQTPVANFIGIGRFIMSMLEDVEIIKPVSLKNHIQKRVKKYLEE